MSADIRRVRVGDESLLDAVAPEVFDDPVNPATLKRFLAEPNHHLFVAIDSGIVAGFVSAVLYEHPDKTAPELWINEFGVAPSHQRHGIGGALLDALLAHARVLGCSEAWVLTNQNNTKARRLYASRTNQPVIDVQMFTFLLADPASGD